MSSSFFQWLNHTHQWCFASDPAAVCLEEATLQVDTKSGAGAGVLGCRVVSLVRHQGIGNSSSKLNQIIFKIQNFLLCLFTKMERYYTGKIFCSQRNDRFKRKRLDSVIFTVQLHKCMSLSCSIPCISKTISNRGGKVVQKTVAGGRYT